MQEKAQRTLAVKLICQMSPNVMHGCQGKSENQGPLFLPQSKEDVAHIEVCCGVRTQVNIKLIANIRGLMSKVSSRVWKLICAKLRKEGLPGA